ncbi:polysaccharide deacetylase family protein [Actinokineospora inagensis]|uniref:polysaccharide deacetylase family protein n=1 Tax=Actinokineospora inagensis TaxID=103730 RepID=UPI00055943D8|nr:polysaccharide deacetylase family protein [Actinokineospora inagensis]
MLKHLALAAAALVAVATPAAAATPTSDVVYSARSTGQVLALTFDDGPSPDWTPKVLELLRLQKVRAVFCLLGSEATKYPDLVRQIVADGHPLCNHTMTHDDLSAMTADQIRADLTATDTAIRTAAGNPNLPIPYFRAPFGIWGNNVPTIAASLGHTSLGWSVDPRDWDGSPSTVIIDRLSTSVYPGAVVLSHDGGGDRNPTLTAYQQLIPQWKTAGWKFDLPVNTAGTYPCTAGSWQRNGTYVAGTRVTQDGKLYQANWWTRDERPTAAPWTWTNLGTC